MGFSRCIVLHFLTHRLLQAEERVTSTLVRQSSCLAYASCLKRRLPDRCACFTVITEYDFRKCLLEGSLHQVLEYSQAI